MSGNRPPGQLRDERVDTAPRRCMWAVCLVVVVVVVVLLGGAATAATASTPLGVNTTTGCLPAGIGLRITPRPSGVLTLDAAAWRPPSRSTSC